MSKKSMMYWWHALDDLTWNYPMKNFFLLATIAMITVKCLWPIFIAAVVRETYFFIKIMQHISLNYKWENGVKQIKITVENLSQSSMLCQLLRTKTLASEAKCIKHFCFIFTTIYLLRFDVTYLTCLVFPKSPWWLVWIFVLQPP